MNLNRRKLLQIAAATGIGATVLTKTNRPSTASDKKPTARLTAQADSFAAEVDRGLTYFKEEAVKQLPLVEALASAIATGDLEAAKQAYIDARPPYEQIEVLALNFADTDTNIDARPYAFDNGEEDEGFVGFHRIEGLIFRDGNVADAAPYAQGLITDVQQLMTDLETRENFDSPSHFEGMIALATEVPAKKISSEEETWSDQSILIFQENWRGIYSQLEPFLEKVQSVDAQVAANATSTYEAAMAVVKPYFTEGQVAATPYSSLNPTQRGEIVTVAYRFRDAIIAVQETLGIVIG
jgi:iron uptake system component EfeO